MMKTFFLKIIAPLLALAILSCNKEKAISEQELPVAVKTYITTHFPSNKITRVVKDQEFAGQTTFDVWLDNGIHLEFDAKNNTLKDIDGSIKLPDSIIQPSILTYVKNNYPDNFIVGWEIEGANQQVELNNKLCLWFNMSGIFIKSEPK